MSNPYGSPTDDDDDDFSAEFDGDETATVAAGTYTARVVDVVKGDSKAGNPMWTWTFAVTGNEKGKKSDFDGKELKLWTALTPAAMWKLSETVQALGIPVEDNKIKCKKGDLVGKSCLIEVQEDEYNGRPSAKINKCLPLK